MPQLQQLAERGKLKEPAILESGGQAHVGGFLVQIGLHGISFEQWLGLDGMDSVTHIADDDLKKAMQERTRSLF